MKKLAIAVMVLGLESCANTAPATQEILSINNNNNLDKMEKICLEVKTENFTLFTK